MPSEDLMAFEDEIADPAEPKPGRAAVLAGLAFLLALGALALSALMWLEGLDSAEPDAELQASLNRLQQSQSSQAQILAALESRLEAAAPRGADGDWEALESALSEQQARSRALQQDLDSQQSYSGSLQQAIESMQARLMALESGLAAKAPARLAAPEQLDLAGVEYLLRLAPERLALFHDLRSADKALALADARLEAMDNPIYLGLRRHIADARQALAEMDLPNPVELSAELDALQARLVGLRFEDEGGGEPFAADTAAESDAGEPGWWPRLKASLSGLVTVRRSATDATTRLTLDDKDLLRQGLWMQIEAARLALMRRDQAAWDDALTRSMGALDRWFDESSPEHAAVLKGLEALSRRTISPDLPDISGPWDQLRLIREVRGATLPEAPLPEAGSQEEATDEGDGGEDETTAGDPAPDGSR